MEKPAELFARDHEWTDLTDFVTDQAPGVRIAVVYGRRRQGKSFLLRELARQTGGLYYQALEEQRPQALDRLGAAVAGRMGFGGSVRFADWAEALRAVTSLPPAGPAPVRLVVLDELPYLLANSPELPSAIQQLYDDSRSSPAAPAVRLVLCGSALSVMSTLLTGTRALRGRASLDMLIQPFDYRQAREFWQVQDVTLAFELHAIVGGTPGYFDLLGRSAPSSRRALGGWLAKGLLNPSHALFREADYLLNEDPGLSDRSLYHSVLGAISRGMRTPTKIGGDLQRDEGSLRHPLTQLERAGFIRRDEDVLLQRKPSLRVADPVVRFDHVVIRPRLAALEERQGAQVWAESRESFASQILGPHLEDLARAWTRRFASAETLGGPGGEVGETVLSDPQGKAQFQVDVVALAAGERRQSPAPVIRLLGEAKGSYAERGLADLRRLERVRDLLDARRRADVRHARLALFGRNGFSRDLRDEARRSDDVVLVDLERLYEGD